MGNLDELVRGYFFSARKLVPGSALHARQLIERMQRSEGETLRTLRFWVADFILYSVDGGAPNVHVANGSYNLLFSGNSRAPGQLEAKSYYIPHPDDSRYVIQRKSTLSLPMHELNLEKNWGEFWYFAINTADYSSLTGAQRQFAERIYRRGKKFDKTMAFMRRLGIEQVKVYLLGPAFVAANARFSPICRLSFLDNYESSFTFYGCHSIAKTKGHYWVGIIK